MCEERQSPSRNVFRLEWTVKGRNLTAFRRRAAHISAAETNQTLQRQSMMWNACKYDDQRNINSRCAVGSVRTVIANPNPSIAHIMINIVFAATATLNIWSKNSDGKNIVVHLENAEPNCDIQCFRSPFPSAFCSVDCRVVSIKHCWLHCI